MQARPDLPSWLTWVDDLLAGPPPGETPFLIDELWVDGAIGPLLGAPKVGKTWLLLELALSVASGRPALDEFAVTQPGPVVVVLEESGLDAARRRLHALTTDEDSPPRMVALAANAHVRLDDEEWRRRLRAVVEEIQPRAVLLDPFVRLKGGIDENSQRELEPVLDFLRELRDVCGSAVIFAAHTGHGGGRRIRGSSDLEAFWESKLSITARGGGVHLAAEHRESDVRASFRYHLSAGTREGRLHLRGVDARVNPISLIEQFLVENPGSSTEQIVRGVRGRAEDLRAAIKEAEATGRLQREGAFGSDALGRRRATSAWYAVTDGVRITARGTRTTEDGGSLDD
jgi:hypothetical protein